MKNTFLKHSILLFLAIVCLFAVACKNDGGNETVTTPADVGAVIAGGEGSVFTIVYPARWSNNEMKAAEDLKSALSTSYASFPKLVDDSKQATEYEILVGNTDRPESSAVLEGLNDYGWAVRVIGNKVVINAKSDQFLKDAVESFIRTYAGSAEQIGIKSISDQIGNNEKYDQTYVISVGNRSVYTVSYPASGSDYLKSSAMAFCKDLKMNLGINLSTKSGKVSSGKAITLKVDDGIEGWKIVFEENGNISLIGQTDSLAICAMNRFEETYLKKDADGDILIQNSNRVSDPADDYMRIGWLLAAPAFEGGTLAPRLYSCGTGIEKDGGGASDEKSYMMCVSGTTAAQFENYLYKLEDCGYQIDSENSMQSANSRANQFCGYRKGSQYLWAYYLADLGEVRIIEDRASTPVSEFEYTFDYDDNTETDLYLYGMKYNENGGSGAFLIIKQADNSVILVDGGSVNQATPAAINGLWRFLHEITGKSESEKIVISCWFITHPHGDHYALVSSLITSYNEHLDLQRVMFNFPDPNEVDGNKMGIDESARSSISKNYPNVKFLKCHTGQSIKLGSLVMDVMITSEDAVDISTGKTAMIEGNSMTSVVRITFADGTRYLELGDFTGDQDQDPKRQDTFVKMYAGSEFICKIVTIAHHGYNSLAQIYPKIKANYALWTNLSPDEMVLDSDTRWKQVRAGQIETQLKNSDVTPKIYYAGQKTVKLGCKNGTVTVSEYTPVY